MSVDAPYKLDAIVLPSAAVISQITSERLAAGVQSMITRPAGHVHPLYRFNDSVQPMVEFATTDIATVLGYCGVGGTAFTSALNAYLKKATQTGSVARASLVHKRIAVTEGLFYWSSLRLPHRGRGEVNVSVLAGYDGTNDPFVYTGSVALPGNLTDGLYYGAGPVSVNGVLIPGIQEIQVDSGVRVARHGGESEEFDTWIAVQETEPIVTIRTHEATNWSTVVLRGNALNGADVGGTGLRFYARHLRSSNAATTHIFGQALIGTILPVDSNGENTSLVTDTLRVECLASSDSTVPLGFTTGVAIT